MLLGICFGLAACALWGVTYILPLLLPEYDTLYLSIGRAVVMGLTAIVGLIVQKHYLQMVDKKDWVTAFNLTLFGNLLQPRCLFSAVQYSGVPLAATFFGLVPVLVAIIANERDRRKGKIYLPFKNLIIPLAMILAGLGFANFEGLMDSIGSNTSILNFIIGVVFASASTAMWTWYPIRNADWLIEHPNISPVFFTSMQCSLLLPFGLGLYFAVWYFKADMTNLLGPKPADFVTWMLVAGVFCSFVATALWNAMSQRVPTALVGQMLVFETIFSVVWGHLYEWKFPASTMVIGMTLLVAGVCYALALFSRLEADNKLEIKAEESIGA